MKSYKKTIIVFSILLLISLWYMYSNFQFYTESKANFNSSIDLNDNGMTNDEYDTANNNIAKDTSVFNDIKVAVDSSKNINTQQDIQQVDYSSIFLTNNNLPTDYQQLIIKKNIFGLTEKTDKPVINKNVEPQKEAEEVKEENFDKIEIAEEKAIQEKSKNQSEINDSIHDKNDEVNRPQVEEKNFREEVIEPIANPFFLQAVSINDKDKMAIIVNRNNSKSYLIKPGQEIDDYIVKSIDYKEIVMGKDNQEIHVVFQN